MKERNVVDRLSVDISIVTRRSDEEVLEGMFYDTPKQRHSGKVLMAQ